MLLPISQYIRFCVVTKNRDMGREQKANGAANGLSRLFTLALLSKQTLIDQSIVMSRL